MKQSETKETEKQLKEANEQIENKCLEFEQERDQLLEIINRQKCKLKRFEQLSGYLSGPSGENVKCLVNKIEQLEIQNRNLKNDEEIKERELRRMREIYQKTTFVSPKKTSDANLNVKTNINGGANTAIMKDIIKPIVRNYNIKD